MRSDVYVTVRRHRPLRPVDVLNPVMMTYWVMRFVLWVLAVGMVIMVVSMVVLVELLWKLGRLAVDWLVARIEDKPKPPVDYVLPGWADVPDWVPTHAEVLAGLKPEIADQFREEKPVPSTDPHKPWFYADGTPVHMDVDSAGRVYTHPRIAAESQHFTDEMVIQRWGEELPYGSYADDRNRPGAIGLG